MSTECITEPVYVTKCDKCGEKRDHGARYSGEDWRCFLPPSLPNVYCDDRSLDLCPKCVLALRLWLGLDLGTTRT
jgi:hypothetical protein